MLSEFKNVKIFYRDVVDSTNNEALRIIENSKLRNNFVVYADYQTKGRGLNNNRWFSDRGKNMIYTIVIFHDNFPAVKQFAISQAIALACLKSLEKIGINDINIKWPNDLYFKNKKIGGILIENCICGNLIDYSICGVGINLNQTNFSDNIPNPISAKLIIGNDINIEDFILSCTDKILIFYDILKEGNFNLLEDLYIEKLFLYNVYSLYNYKDKVIEAKIVGITEFGELILEKNSGDRIVCRTKEIEYIF